MGGGGFGVDVGAGGRGVAVLVGGPRVGVGGSVGVGGTGGVVGSGGGVGSGVLVGLASTMGVEVKVGTKVFVGVGVAAGLWNSPPIEHPTSIAANRGRIMNATSLLLITLLSLPYCVHYNRFEAECKAVTGADQRASLSIWPMRNRYAPGASAGMMLWSDVVGHVACDTEGIVPLACAASLVAGDCRHWWRGESMGGPSPPCPGPGWCARQRLRLMPKESSVASRRRQAPAANGA